jgi:aldehyde dehydrogenase (NAD+)
MSVIAFDQHEAAARRLPSNSAVIGTPQRLTSGLVHDHINPATGRKQAEVPYAGAADVDRAVAAARKGFEAWRRTKPSVRGALLHRLVQLIDEHKEEFATLSALENGIPYFQFEVQWNLMIKGWLTYYAGYADKIEGSVTASYPAEHFEYVVPEPFGVIACIIPWNAPMISLSMKVAPALAAGCAVIIKPPEFTPFTSIRFAELALEAGIPEGVVNAIPGGVEAGEALVRHKGVDKISFTGGIVAAKKVLASCAEGLKPSLYELGGKSANIVFADADLDKALLHAAMFPFSNSGQGCQLPTRLLVQDSIYDDFVEGVVGAVKTLKVGDTLAQDTYMGPVVSQVALNRILAAIEQGKNGKSGRLATGGARAGGGLSDGFFIEPTVFCDVDPMSQLAQNEIFGPVLSIFRFTDEQDAVRLANSTEWGLAGYIWTQNLGRAHRVASDLTCGNVMINGSPNAQPGSPFGGVGLSGFGREGGRWGLEEFIRTKGIGVVI